MAARKKAENTSKSPKELSDHHSVEHMLEYVNEFMEGVYRDLRMSTPAQRPPLDVSSNRTITHTPRSSSPLGAVGGALSPISKCSVSPTKHRNMDVEIDKINRMCENVDQNLRSIGVFMNNSLDTASSEENRPNSGANPPSPLTPSLGDLVTSSLLPTTERQTTRRRGDDVEYRATVDVTDHIIDLSDTQTQTPIVLRQQNYRLNNDDDDDVILVSDNLNPIVDLCTPGTQEPPTRRSAIINRSQLSRRRLSRADVVEQNTCHECGPTTAKKRRSENSTLNACSSTNKSAQTASSDITPTLLDPAPAPGPTPFMCAVCMESCLQRQPTSTKCGHVFCQECIRQAIRLTHKCPLCNTKITNTQIFRIYL